MAFYFDTFDPSGKIVSVSHRVGGYPEPIFKKIKYIYFRLLKPMFSMVKIHILVIDKLSLGYTIIALAIENFGAIRLFIFIGNRRLPGVYFKEIEF